MTDRDVVARVARLFDRRSWRSDRGIEVGCKPVYLTAIKGAAAVHLMSALRPVMGVRRQTQIDRALVSPHSSRPRWYRRAAACAAPTCRRPVHAKGLCKIHYDSWWKAKKRGHTYKYAPVDAPMPAGIDAIGPLFEPVSGTPAAMAWLAGLLEGEGTFERHRQGRRTYPRLSLEMCDEDVVVRVASLIDAPSVWSEPPRREGWSQTFHAAITGTKAAAVMSGLLPHMGERRGHEIRRALDAYEPPRLSRQRACVVAGCGAPHASRGLCHRHHTLWWRDMRAGRAPRVAPLR